MNDLLNQIRQLPPADRLELANRLWGELAEMPDAIELSPQQRQLLNERLAEYERAPDSARPWSDVRADTRRQV